MRIQSYESKTQSMYEVFLIEVCSNQENLILKLSLGGNPTFCANSVPIDIYTGWVEFFAQKRISSEIQP